jgi:hypothetical protein
MATTGAERMRAHRARRRRRVRKLTIEVSEDDLRAIAERDYEGAVSTDHDQEAQAVALFLNDALNPRPILVSLSPSGASFRVGPRGHHALGDLRPSELLGSIGSRFSRRPRRQ